MFLAPKYWIRGDAEVEPGAVAIGKRRDSASRRAGIIF
jgi:hypothetical protein